MVSDVDRQAAAALDMKFRIDVIYVWQQDSLHNSLACAYFNREPAFKPIRELGTLTYFYFHPVKTCTLKRRRIVAKMAVRMLKLMVERAMRSPPIYTLS